MRSRLIAAIVALLVAITTTTLFLMRERRAKEEAARKHAMSTALAALRSDLAGFRAKNGRYPRSLDELSSLPRDPVTHSTRTWQVETEESVRADDFSPGSKTSETFIVNVRSGARGRDAHGRAWADY